LVSRVRTHHSRLKNPENVISSGSLVWSSWRPPSASAGWRKCWSHSSGRVLLSTGRWRCGGQILAECGGWIWRSAPLWPSRRKSEAAESWPGWVVMKSVSYYRVVVPVVVDFAARYEGIEVLMKMSEIPGEVAMLSGRLAVGRPRRVVPHEGASWPERRGKSATVADQRGYS
jgi:hypothetical protein